MVPTIFQRPIGTPSWRLNLISGKAGDHPVVAFDDLGVYRLLASTLGSSEIEKFMTQWLGPLLEYDERRNSDLVLTLYRYLECGGRYDETAEALLIHRSTLRYRLQRIRDISQLPIGEADVNFNLQLACRAWSTRKALRSPGWR